ncbi:F0F1 ATP synthase subunit C [uncultured Veillonella sp.]|uniref:F0F1 ATP synthase subunit C n=1 Tax=uncultured Veillonella sp. TaxID=159268 RepID=UPI00260E5FF8|nr:F0F1 ATP synthase subunit C [uncultured Veillonella sp.]
MEKAILLSVSVFSACFVAGLAALAAAFGDAFAASKAFDGMTRQPEMAGKIMTNLFIVIGLIEAIPIIAIVIAIVLVFTDTVVGKL